MALGKWAGLVLGGMAWAAGIREASAGENNRPDPWSGVYVGAIGAFSRNTIKGSSVGADGVASPSAIRDSAQVNDRAGGLGALVGWRREFIPGFVAGVEADVSGLNHDSTGVNRQSAGLLVATLRYQTTAVATGRLTAGWSFGDVLVFGTGGVALARETETRTQYRLLAGETTPQFSERSSATRIGPAVGVGAEWRISGRWSLRADYLYAYFPSTRFEFPNTRGGVQGAYTSVVGRIAHNNAHLNQVRLGISYTFDLGH